jgi:hypothetical protein
MLASEHQYPTKRQNSAMNAPIAGVLACILGCCTVPAARASDLYRCTIRDVVEITHSGTVGRRPALTQFEMTLHPTFEVEGTSGKLRSTRQGTQTGWLLIQPGNDRDDLVTISPSEQRPGAPPSELVRIQASRGRERAPFLWLSDTTLRTGDCEPG